LLLENNNARFTLRNPSDQRNFHARTNIFYHSYFPYTLRVWNDLSESSRNAQSLDIFQTYATEPLSGNQRTALLLHRP